VVNSLNDNCRCAKATAVAVVIPLQFLPRRLEHPGFEFFLSQKANLDAHAVANVFFKLVPKMLKLLLSKGEDESAQNLVLLRLVFHFAGVN